MHAYTVNIDNIVIPHEEPLPEKLREVLDSWGSSPHEEPEFYNFMSKSGTTLDEVKLKALKDANEDDFSALDVANLANRVRYKITGKIDDDGMYKTTPNIDMVKLPKTSQLRELKKLAKENTSQKDLSKEIFKIAGVDAEKLTEWEATLVDEMITAFSQAVDNNTLGNTADRTPFARYIKN